MPNTLAHLGVQALATRALVRDVDERWIYAGAVVPDVGWILQRMIQAAIPAPSPDLRLYAIVQTSLWCSLLLAGALSLFARQRAKVFAVLALNVLLHLLLDACEIKWANGVVLFAPVSWEALNWGWFWPEDWPAHLLTLVGAAYVALTTRRLIRTPLDLSWPVPAAQVAATVLLCAYLALPWALRSRPLASDSHFVGAITDVQQRAGTYVEFDRATYRANPPSIQSPLLAEPVRAVGIAIGRDSVVSIRGRFLDEAHLEVQSYHDHGGRGRDVPSIVALTYIFMICALALVRGRLSPAFDGAGP